MLLEGAGSGATAAARAWRRVLCCCVLCRSATLLRLAATPWVAARSWELSILTGTPAGLASFSPYAVSAAVTASAAARAAAAAKAFCCCSGCLACCSRGGWVASGALVKAVQAGLGYAISARSQLFNYSASIPSTKHGLHSHTCMPAAL